MRMKTGLFGLLIAFIVGACNSGNDKSQTFYYGFTNKAWESSLTVPFQFDISDTSIRYNVTGKLRYNNEFTFSTLDMSVSLLTPSGSSRFKKIHLEMRDRNGDDTGVEVGDYMELPFEVYDSMRFTEAGKWVLNFNHNMPVDIHHGMVGLEIFIQQTQ